ncbi:MAG: hypothetical protein EA406_11820 [Rhodospirillales bacterium]|nr:MAG: hypothetical protein EA406_11820 [Rhodospirillales bacterium]
MFSGAQFSATSIPNPAGPLIESLNRWGARKREEVEQDALRRVQAAAIRAQRPLGVEGMAEVPSDVRGQFADQFRATSEAVFTASLDRTMQQETRNLIQQYGDDPELFAHAYNALMVGQLAPLEESNIVLAEDVRQKLDRIGMDIMFELEDDAAARAQAQAKFETLSAFSEFTSEVFDELNRTGSEASMARYIEQANEMLEAQYEAGFITTEQFVSRRSRFRNSAATEQAFGAFRQAVERGDIAGAEAIIERTDRGLMFDDNPDGRATASQLSTRLRDLMRGAEEQSLNLHTAAMRTIDNAVDRAARGRPINMEDLQPAFDTAVTHANTGGQIDAVMRARQALAVAMATSRDMQQLSPGDLVALAEFVDTADEMLPAGLSGQLLDTIERRQNEINEAVVTGDVFRLADLPFGAPLEQRNQARQNIADTFGVAPNFVPHYSRADVRRFRQEFDGFLDRGDTAGAVGILERFFEPVGDDLASRLGLAQQYGESGMSAIASLGALVGPGNLVMLMERARQADENLTPQERSDALRPAVLRRIDELAEAAAIGHPDIQNQIAQVLSSAWAGIATETGESGQRSLLLRRPTATLQQFDQLIEPMLGVQTLSNGALVPEGFLPEGVPGRASAREINGWLEDPEHFGIVPGDMNALDSIRPRFLPDGGVAWFSTRSPNELILDPRTGEVLVDDLEARVAPARDIPTLGERIFEGINNAMQASGELLSFGGYSTNSARTAANVTGADLDTLLSIRMVYETLPLSDRANREPSTLLSEATLQSLPQAEYRRAWMASQARRPTTGQFPTEGPPSPLRNTDGAAIAAGLILERFRAKYATEEQALAAYWMGEAVMDSLGDDWENQIDQSTAQFIHRVRHNNGRLGGGR